MQIEIEAKVKVDTHWPIVERLEQLGAVLVGDMIQTDAYFDDFERNLLAHDKGLRIRRQVSSGDEQVILTFKGACEDGKFKTRPEHDIKVGDQSELVNVLSGLGFNSMLTVEKKRRMWELNDCEVCLDEVKLLGCFVEVEGPSEVKIAETLKMLELDSLEHISCGYARMTAEKLDKEA